MKRLRVLVPATAVLLSSSLFSCSGTVCGEGTHLDDATQSCLADPVDLAMDLAMKPPADIAMNPPDLPPMVMCGTNTTYNAQTNTCEIQSSVCLQGTQFDPTTFSCKIPMDFGTQIYSSGMTQIYIHFAAKGTATDTDMGTTTTTYTKLGTSLTGGVTLTGVDDSTPLFMSTSHDQVGNIPMIPVFWPEGPPSSVPTAHTTQVTLGEWKKCVGQVSIYKAPPTLPTGFKEVVDMSGCPGDMSFSAWNVYYKGVSTDPMTDRVLSTPAGGMPNFFVSNGAGKAHFERDLDPNVWFKAGALVNGIAHGTKSTDPATPLPDLTTYPNANLGVTVVFHNNGQSNGNPGNCVKDVNGNCVTPASPDVFLPGNNGKDSANAFSATPPGAGQEAYCNGGAGKCNPIPLSMLQPF